MTQLEKLFIKAFEKVEQEPCTDAVSREAVINLFRGNIGSEAALILYMVKQLPSVTQKSGHWIRHYLEDEKVGWYECDLCHTERGFNTRFCPDCGAKMESEEKK